MNERRGGEQDTRQQILAVARRLFGERGYAQTSLADIAAELGITKTGVAYHFHPKETLLTELLAAAATDLGALLDMPVAPSRDGQRAFLRAYGELLLRHRDAIAVLTDGTVADHAVHGTAMRALREAVLARLVPAEQGAAERVGAWAAIGAVHVSVRRTLDLPLEIVRPAVIAAALAAFDSGRDSQMSGSVGARLRDAHPGQGEPGLDQRQRPWEIPHPGPGDHDREDR